MPNVGVVLSGCGVMDGSEIHEAVLTLFCLQKRGAKVQCLAPDMEQHDVINHLTQEPMKEKRNVLVESARIARGKIKDIRKTDVQELDAVIFPGGYGAAKNLCTFGLKGADCEVEKSVAQFVRKMHEAGKPIGAICIAPALMAKIFEGSGIQVTIGSDAGTAAGITKLGLHHVVCAVSEICVDKRNKVVTTPAYMLAQNLVEAYEGIDKLVEEVLKLAEAN